MLDILRDSIRWRFYVLSLPAQVWAGVMLAMAVTPDLGPLSDIDLFEQQDKAFHFGEYVVLSVLVAFSLIEGTSWERPDLLKTSFGLPAIYGVFLEAIQPLIPYRDASGLDALANVFGAAIGAAVAIYVLGPYLLRKG